MTDHRSLWEDLKQRRVVRAVAIYAVVGWGAFEVTESVTPILGFPELVPQIVLFLLLLGFPLVSGLAWAFDVDRSGVQRAAPSERRGRMWVAVAGATVLAVGIGLYTVRTAFELPDASELDRSTVAVAPFRASLGPDLAYLGEGMVDLLAVRLSEETGIRAVDPASMFGALGKRDESPEREELSRIAARLGAGRLLSGSIVGPAPRVTITAELVDVGGGDVATQEVTGSIDSLPVLVDRLVSQLLSIEAGERRERVRYLADSPPEAVRDYLRGRSLYRGGDYPGATDAFLSAIRTDSTFALAGMALSNAAGMSATAPPGAQALGNRTAWNNRDRLPPADREFLRYWLGEAYPEARSDRERIAAGQEAVERFPDRIEAWYFHADRLFHDGAATGIPDATRLAWSGFQRMLEIDPDHVVALQHLLWLSGLVDQSDSVRLDLARRILANTGGMSSTRWEAARVLGRSDLLAGFEASLAELPEEALLTIGFWTGIPVWGPAFAMEHDEVDRTIEELRSRSTVQAVSPGIFLLELNRGRLGSVERQMEIWRQRGGDPREIDRLLVLIGLFGDGNEAVAAAAAERLSEGVLDPIDGEAPGLGRVRSACAVGLWRYRQGRGDRAADVLEWLRELDPGSVRLRDEIDVCVMLLEATGAVVEGESDAADRIAELEEWSLEGPSIDNYLQGALHLAIGRMWRALGDREREWESLARCCRAFPQNLAFRATTAFELAEVSVALGDLPTAIREFDYYVRARATADEVLQDEVEYAQRELDRLASGN